MNCAETNTDRKWQLSFEETVEFLEPVPDKDDPEHPGEKIKGRGGAVCFSSAHYKKMKDAQELACRLLGNRCSYEMQQLLFTH